jgi:hypothetical protein
MLLPRIIASFLFPLCPRTLSFMVKDLMSSSESNDFTTKKMNRRSRSATRSYLVKLDPNPIPPNSPACEHRSSGSARSNWPHKPFVFVIVIS